MKKIQQCIRRELPEQNEPVLALLIHDIPLRNIVESLNPPYWANLSNNNIIRHLAQLAVLVIYKGGVNSI